MVFGSMRPLVRTESEAVPRRLLPGNPEAAVLAGKTLFATGGQTRSLAAIYRAASADLTA